MSHKVLIPLCIVLGAGAGVAASYGVFRSCPVKEPCAPDAGVSAKQIAQLQRDMADLQAKCAKLEARPDFKAVMNDPSLRQQLAALVEETKGASAAGPRPAPTDADAWRRGLAIRFRQDYGKLVEEALDAMKLQGPDRQKAKAEFDVHFEPVEAQLRKLEQKEISNFPRVNPLVGPQLAVFMSRLEKAVPAEAFKAFEAWRKAPAASLTWGQGKSDYFMSGNDFTESQVNTAVEMHWQLLSSSLTGVWLEAKVNEEKQKKLEPLLRRHLQQVFGELRKDEPPSLTAPRAMARNQAFTNVTEAAMVGVIGKDGVEVFRKWKNSPGNRCSYLFGVLPRAPEVVAPGNLPPSPLPERPFGAQ